MNFVKPPYLLSKLTKKNLVWQIHTSKPVIYLTFDDGPIPEITPFVLKILKEFKAKATFFCVGDNVRKYPNIFNEILVDGHQIGNHTFNHLNGWQTHTSDYIENIEKCNNFYTTELFRPPYGKLKPSQVKEIRKTKAIVLWSVLSCDFDQHVTKEECLNNAISYTNNGAVVVFHDNIKAKENMFYALPRFMAYFTDKGYTFERLTKALCEKTLC